MWERQVEVLAKHHKCVLWDVRGHGKSTLPGGKVMATDFQQDLLELIRFIGAKKVTLCGLSMGGHISLQFAAEQHELIRGLILLGTPFSNRYTFSDKIAVPINRFFSKFLSMETTARLSGQLLSKVRVSTGEYAREALKSIPKESWVRVWDCVTRMESTHLLKKITCPTLILHGELDTMVAGQQQYLHRAIKGSSFRRIPQAHHGTNLDNPEEVNRHIIAFLAEHNL